MRINIARTLPRSAANGPGERFVIWVQGCPLACPGCWNPDTWSFRYRDIREVTDLVQFILATDGIEGVTFTGGEPFAQARALSEVACAVRAAGLSVFIFTGYELAELRNTEQRALLDCTDVLVTGRYVKALRTIDLPWRGSTNQKVHFLSSRYSPADLAHAADAEIHIDSDGAATITGFPSPDLFGPSFQH